MKIDDKFYYNEKKKKWYRKGSGKSWEYREHCKKCGEPYYTRCDKPSDFCCPSCCRSGENNYMYGRTHTDEVKQLLRENVKKTHKTIKERYGVDNISQINDIKKKKGQTILSEEYIRNYVKQFGYELLEKDELNNKKTMLKLKCPNGHIFNIRYESFQVGSRCKECFYESLRKDWTIEEIYNYEEYKKQVQSLSNITYRKYKKIINPNNYKRGHGENDYQLDHKFSIIEGFKQNVPVEVMSSLVNLELLKAFDNASKQGNCSITLEELYESYINMNK